METVHRQHRARGFSLIELSVVMVIIGVIIAAGITIYKPSVINVMDAKTKIIISANIDALVGYSAVQQRLPSHEGYPSLVRSQKDGFGNDTIYIPAHGFTGLRSVCDTSFTNLSLVPRRGGARVNNVAFIIQSYGNDGENDLKREYPSQPPDDDDGNNDGNNDGKHDGKYDGKHYGRHDGRHDGKHWDNDDQEDDVPFDIGKKTIYTVPTWVGGNDKAIAKDDIVEWATMAEIQAAAKCGPALRITTTNLANGVDRRPYLSDIFALGGTHFRSGGNYEWCGTGFLTHGLGLVTVNNDKSVRALSRSDECSFDSGNWSRGDYISVYSWNHHPKKGVGTLKVFVRDNDGSNTAQHHYASETFILDVAVGNRCVWWRYSKGQTIL